METRERILAGYTAYLQEHGHPPKSVRAFCKPLEISDAEFFRNFGSLDAVESELWRTRIDHVIASLRLGPEWVQFSARERMTAFLFAFLEDSLELRSALLTRQCEIHPLARPAWLSGLRRSHRAFVQEVIDRGLETGKIAERGTLINVYPDVFHAHLLAIIGYHLRDTSPGYERTDAFIEKSVRLAFDLIGTQAVDSAADLLRFLIPSR